MNRAVLMANVSAPVSLQAAAQRRVSAVVLLKRKQPVSVEMATYRAAPMEASSLTPMSCSSRRMISPQAAALASTKACRPNWRFPAWWSICSSTAQSGRSNGSRFSAAMSTLTTQALDGSVSHVSLPSHGRNFSVNCGFSST